MQENNPACVNISEAMQHIENGGADAVPVCGQNGETLAWLVPTQKYDEMVARIEEMKDIVMIPLLTEKEILKKFGGD